MISVLRHKFHDLALHNSTILGLVTPVVRVLGSVAPVLVHYVCRLSISRILLKYFEVAGYGCFVDGALAFENLRPSTVH